MTKVAIIGDCACARELIKHIKKSRNTGFAGQFVPEDLPGVMDDSPEIPQFVLSADVVLDYSRHPDMPYALKGAKRVITNAKCIRVNLPDSRDSVCENSQTRELKNAKCIDCFCAADISEDFGVPEFKVVVENGILKDIEVVKSSPCGAAYLLADELKGLAVEEALDKTGLLAQYLCRGKGGPNSSIHKAAEIHKRALEKAVKQVK
ncbi:MAG: hypothetical protein MSIBF_02280 [Candidatus Altiarchaeales archaeon IMC4]|nr:MAG: hypothetical protein MSIBF_02280 [Candidatus Altiarchaeales archaeon IMC4]